jgi:hypothetical protein
MIARVSIQLPFNILLAVDEKFLNVWVEDSGYKIFYLPPGRDPNLVSTSEPSTITLNEKDAILCNIITFDFQKEEFDRTISEDVSKIMQFEPSLELINKVLNNFLIRLRHLTNAAQIHLIDIHYNQWRITYLNDDLTELQEEKGKLRGRGARKFEIKYVPLNSEIWNDIFKLPSDFLSQYYWVDLLLDGLDELPEMGPSIVLTFTALEVFIARILNQLASTKKELISPDCWEWINHRPEWPQEPSVEEQYDTLLKIFTGHSLKEDTKLWAGFKNLKTARNTFVHEGVAKISKNTQTPLTTQEAHNLLILTNGIPLKIREWLPKDLQWELNKNYNTVANLVWPLSTVESDKVVKRRVDPIPPGST